MTDVQMIEAVSGVSTNVQWSTLGAVAKKMYTRQSESCTPEKVRALARQLRHQPVDVLALNGVWLHDFGEQYQPIVITNAAYRRARAQLPPTGDGGGTPVPCTCGANTAAGGGGLGAEARYFTSMDYNAGKHALHNSGHKANCPQWSPPTSSHLHSWRRGYE